MADPEGKDPGDAGLVFADRNQDGATGGVTLTATLSRCPPAA